MPDHPPSAMTLRLGARGSLLSRMQSAAVAEALHKAHPRLRVEIVAIATSGDAIADRPLHAFGGKGLFTRELELALLRGDVDFAVHSFKDVPVTMPLVDGADLAIVSVPLREDPRDVLAGDKAASIADLPPGARVGTGSLRRQAQLLALRPDVSVLTIRGNIDTRLRKLRAGEYDAILLALAGLKRAGLFDPATMTPLSMDDMLPAAGQGALALQCRRDRPDVIAALQALNHGPTFDAVALERQVVQLLDGDCHSPIGACAGIDAAGVQLSIMAAAQSGLPPMHKASVRLPLHEARQAPQAAVDQLRAQGYTKD